jgi:hypothetical protein
MAQKRQPETMPVIDTTEALARKEITATMCHDCGAEVHGVNARYACGLCGWVNHWSEGSTPLLTAEDDPDYPGR